LAVNLSIEGIFEVKAMSKSIAQKIYEKFSPCLKDVETASMVLSYNDSTNGEDTVYLFEDESFIIVHVAPNADTPYAVSWNAGE